MNEWHHIKKHKSFNFEKAYKWWIHEWVKYKIKKYNKENIDHKCNSPDAYNELFNCSSLLIREYIDNLIMEWNLQKNIDLFKILKLLYNNSKIIEFTHQDFLQLLKNRMKMHLLRLSKKIPLLVISLILDYMIFDQPKEDNIISVTQINFYNYEKDIHYYSSIRENYTPKDVDRYNDIDLYLKGEKRYNKTFRRMKRIKS